ncbi:MAG: rane transport protein [Candidatus Saccharibacteria bacterium]|nr:rane transport protein [Candidatus Saccharibacteria bacterium]
MSDKLYALGNFCFRHRRLVSFSWLIIIVVTAILAAAFMRTPSTQFDIPGTEAQRTLNRIQNDFPAAANASANLVFAAPEGETIAPYLTEITATILSLRSVDGVVGVTDPQQLQSLLGAGELQASQLPRILPIQVSLEGQRGSISKETQNGILNVVSAARQHGLQVEVGGLSDDAPGEILGIGEIAGVVVATLVLVLTFGSLVAAGMPLLIAILGIALSASAIYAIGGFVDITSTTPTLAIMLGLAVGIDYSLFIISRYRQYLLDGLSKEKALPRAIATAGNAVIFAALTVVIALGALFVVGVPFLTSMGFAAAGTVAVVAILAITLLPALLGFIGEKVLSRGQRNTLKAHKKYLAKSRFLTRWGTFVTKRPWLAMIVPMLLLVVLAIPAFSMRLGLPDDASAKPDTTQRKAYDLISEAYGPGYNGPLIAVVDLPGVSQQDGMARLASVAQNIKQNYDDVTLAVPAQVNKSGTTGLVQIIPREGPTAESTRTLIHQLRTHREAILDGKGSALSLTGNTALAIDVDSKLAAALPVYIAVVVGLSLLILVIVFRSILVPLKATAGFLLSIGAAFGAVVAIFQWGWFGWYEPTLIVSFLPILMVGILFGLAMDYQFFLVSNMHEAYSHDKLDAKKAVRVGFERGAPVVTAAALIMTAVFSGFIFNPDAIVSMIGFGLAIGVFIDAFIVRMTIVPAIMTLFGKAAWWLPKPLDRILPNVSIEKE